MEIQKYYPNIFEKNVHFGQMDISHVALEMFLRKQLKNIYKIKDKAYIHYPKG